jgi:hypothetical protein
VVDVNCSGLYLLGTKEGLLGRLYARNEFTTADNNFIDVRYAPSNSLSLQSTSIKTLEVSRRLQAAIVRGTASIKVQMSFEKYQV